MKTPCSTRTVLFKKGLATISLLLLLSAGPIVRANWMQSDMATQVKQESEFDAKRREGLSKNSPDISFTIRLVGDKKRFRQGEVIPLELSFASSQAKTYRMDAGAYDRSGRLHMDKFHIEPETGFVDPMYDHFHLNRVFLGGGLRGIPELKEKPYLITYELNEWFRFDKPGKYRLYLTSPRVSRIVKREEANNITLTSNAVEFEIVTAEKDWQERELQRIVKALDAKDRQTDRRAACRALRFLSAKGAALELVRRYGDSDNECQFEYYAGLIGSPHRELVMELLETRLTSPDQPISSGWLHLMFLLTMASGHQGLQQPRSGDDQQWREYWERYQEFYNRFQAKYAALLAQSIHLKTGRARAVSANTLLELKWDKTKLPDAASFFNDLPAEQQRLMLGYRWKQIAGDSMLPILRQIYRDRPDRNAEENYEVTEIKALALKGIYELAPDEGRQLIIAEMRRPNPRVGYQSIGRQTLTLLPDETLPELDSLFVDNFEKGGKTEIHSALIERYGSPNVFARVRALLDERVGNMACFEQSRLLAYCLRVDAAGSIGLIRRALGARGEENSRCYPSVFRSVGELHASQDLEKLAIEFLGDPDPEVVIDAAAMLGQNGSDGAEEALWRRFEKWHQEWNGREQELKVDYPDDNPIRIQTSLEQALRMALSNSPAWLADSKKLESLKRLCVTQNERQQVDQLIQRWGSGIEIRFSPAENEWGNAEVAQYNLPSLSALKKKLAQFPKGTVFKWAPFNDGYLDEEKQKLFRELESFLGERGARLVK
jgi:hypothetical protein